MFKESSILCESPYFNDTSTEIHWWCARNETGSRLVPVANVSLNFDSCFCLHYSFYTNTEQTRQNASEYCQSIGAFLADVRDDEEAGMLGKLLAKFSTSEMDFIKW